MRDRREQLAALATLEMGKLRQEAQSEVALSADILDHYARNAEAFLRPQRIAEAPGATIFSRFTSGGRTLTEKLPGR